MRSAGHDRNLLRHWTAIQIAGNETAFCGVGSRISYQLPPWCRLDYRQGETIPTFGSLHRSPGPGMEPLPCGQRGGLVTPAGGQAAPGGRGSGRGWRGD